MKVEQYVLSDTGKCPECESEAFWFIGSDYKRCCKRCDCHYVVMTERDKVKKEGRF